MVPAALGALLVNTHIGQVVNRVAVGQVDPFVIQREVVVMIMTAEGAVRATQLLHRLKQLIRVDTAVHHFAALTGQAVTVLHILRIFIIILHILGPGQAVLLHGKMEKDGSGHHFFQFWHRTSAWQPAEPWPRLGSVLPDPVPHSCTN